MLTTTTPTHTPSKTSPSETSPSQPKPFNAPRPEQLPQPKN